MCFLIGVVVGVLAIGAIGIGFWLSLISGIVGGSGKWWGR